MLGDIHRFNHIALVPQVVGPADGRCQEATNPDKSFVLQNQLCIAVITNSFFPIGFDSVVQILDLIGEVARPQLEEDVYHPKALLLSAANFKVLLRRLVALLDVVL